jgi:1-acyl-sn-glycerol-3-phosphate acyltransferase
MSNPAESVTPGAAVLDLLRAWSYALAPETRERFEKLGAGENEYGVDPFGRSIAYTTAAAAPFLWLYKYYFRVETHGIEHVPEGRLLLVGNHSGQLPFDATMIVAAMLLEANPPRAVRAMAEKWIPTLPFLSTFFARCGQVVGTPENCRRLLAADEAILVFPEGVRGIAKPFRQRYQLQDFGLGFLRLALEADAPIVPIAVIGAEEQAPSLFNFESLAKLARLPALPVTPQGLPLPLPTKYRLYFGEPMRFTGRPDDDEEVLLRKVRGVRSALQALIQQGLRERQHVFW